MYTPNRPSGTHLAIDEICPNTNTYAESHQDKYPYPEGGITRVQFYAYLAIVTYIGANPRSDYFTYCSIDPFFASFYLKSLNINRNTFSAILTFQHISDPDPCAIDSSDRLYKVRVFLECLKVNCIKYYQPRQNLSADERMVKIRSNVHRPVRWGFKLWRSCDSSNGYTYNLEVDRGKEGNTLCSNGLSYEVIIDLVNGLDNQGYIVYKDNFYTSPILLKELANLGFGAVVTLDTSRKGVTSCNRGHDVWIRDGVLVFNLWKDIKVVCTLSTVYKGHFDNKVNRRVKMSGGGVVQVPIPNSITCTTNLWQVLIFLVS